MKLPARLRDLTRRTLGSGRAESIRPEALRELAVAEDVLVIAVGVLAAGTPDDQLPGEQRAASLLGLASAVADVPRERAIVLHCG